MRPRLRLALLAALAGLGWSYARPSPADDAVARERDLRDLMALTDTVAAGGPLGGALALEFAPHFLKGGDGQTYVPFSLSISEHSRRPDGFVVYVRVVVPGQAPPQGEGRPGGVELASANLAPGELPVGGAASQHRRSARVGEASARLSLVGQDREAAKGPYVFEDAYVVSVDAGDEVHPYRLQRALAVPPGDYLVYVAVSEIGETPDAARSAVIRLPFAARGFEGGLRLSSLILAEQVSPLPAGSGAKRQSRRPYALGSVEVVPVTGRELAPDDEPAVAFQIYGAGLGAGGRPAVGIEYLLLRQKDDAYVPHARLPPQRLDARTLPKDFDPAAGHQLGAVQELPVSLLPQGEYLLEVTVTDDVGRKSAKGALDFAVRPR